MVTLGFYPDSKKLRSALYRIINCQHHWKVLISSFHVQTQKLKKHNFKIKTLSLRIYKRRAGQETHVLYKMYLTFLDHNALCSFIKDMIPPVKTKLVSSIITNLHTKWNECQSNYSLTFEEEGLKKGPIQLCGTRRKGIKRSHPDVWNKEEGLKKGPVQMCGTRRWGLKKVSSRCVGQGRRA